MFCYVNSVFAPGLDEGVGGLWKVGVCVFLLFLGRVFEGMEVRREVGGGVGNGGMREIAAQGRGEAGKSNR